MTSLSLDNRQYELKFGMKSLNLLQHFSIENDGENPNVTFSLAIMNNHLSDSEISVLYDNIIATYGIDFLQQKLNEAREESLKGFNSFNEDIYEELYQIAIGEIGITPQSFEEMTPYEITLAYKGYIARQQLQANCMILAIRQSKNEKATKISLLGGEGYDTASTAQRKKTFETLGI